MSKVYTVTLNLNAFLKKMCGNYLTFAISIKIVILHALLTVSMPNILLVMQNYIYFTQYLCETAYLVPVNISGS